MERFFVYKGDKDRKNIEYFMSFPFLIVLLFKPKEKKVTVLKQTMCYVYKT